MSRLRINLLGISLFLLLALPARMWAETTLPEIILGKALLTYQPSLDEPVGSSEETISEPEGALSLLQAQRLALRHNATLAAQAWQREGTAGELAQAGLLPNPELSVEVENFAGDNGMKSFDSAETTVAISQLIELGGKRSKRQKSAELQQTTAFWDYEAKRLDTLTGVSKAYVEVVAAQNRVKQVAALAELSGAVHQTVAERVEAGKVSPIEQTRSAVVLASARLEIEKAKRGLASARQALTAFWGTDQPLFIQATDNLNASPGLPTLDELLPLVRQNPDVVRWETELEHNRTELALAEVQTIPDLTVSVGWRNFQEDDSNAMVAGLEFPLPLFDRNQGGRKTAASAVNQIRYQRNAALAQARSDLSAAYQGLAAAHTELTILSSELLPGAQSAFDAASLGYREGKFGLLDMLDAQRTLFEVRGQFISALVSYHLARADIERLIARPIDSGLLLPTHSNEAQQ